jgi:hypothetical protein
MISMLQNLRKLLKYGGTERRVGLTAFKSLCLLAKTLTFSTVRLRTSKTKGCGSRTACLTMVFKLAKLAESHWRTLNGSVLLEDVI